MSGLRLRLEMMSLTKWRTEYYLIKRKSISLLRVKTSSLLAFLFSDWIKNQSIASECVSISYLLTDIDKHLLHHSPYVYSKLLELISHFCVNFLVNPPDRQISFF